MVELTIISDITNFLNPQKNIVVNCQEAYVIWGIAASKYLFLNNLATYRNYTHDIDLKLVVEKLYNDIHSDVKEHEKIISKIGIGSPDEGILEINATGNSESIRDETIALNIFTYLQGDIENLLRAMRTTTTNDDLREFLLKQTKGSIKRQDSIIAYLRLKGWINDPPIYPNIPPNETEKIDAGEAFHLWDHLTFRYDNIIQTEIYKSLTHDKDFIVLLTVGLQKILKEQVIILEKELLKFGIPLPKHPANVVPSVGITTETLKDDYMFRILFIGIVGAILLHASALKQSTTNDRVRNIFKELLISEIDIQDKFIIYGKMKGYLHEPPQFKLTK